LLVGQPRQEGHNPVEERLADGVAPTDMAATVEGEELRLEVGQSGRPFAENDLRRLELC
jgi:hypothetical protein